MREEQFLLVKVYVSGLLDFDEDSLAIQKRHQAEPEEHKADGVHQRGVDGRSPRGEKFFVDQSEDVALAAVGTREPYERSEEHEVFREEVDRERVRSEDEERDRPTLVAFYVNQPVAERSEEHTSELQSRQYLVCRLLLEKKKTKITEYE